MKRRNVETPKRRKEGALRSAADACGGLAFGRAAISMMVFGAALVFVSAAAFPQNAQDTEQDQVDVDAEVQGEPPAPPSGLAARDQKNDDGKTVLLSWTLSPDDDVELEEQRVAGYRLYRAPFDASGVDEEAFELVADTKDIPAQMREWADKKDVRPSTPYVYRLTAVSPGGAESQPATLNQPIQSQVWYFDRNKSWFLGLTLVISAGIILFIFLAQRGIPLRIRRIAGLEAVDEAVGRATEMGRSILFVPGIQDMNNIQTVAGMTILARIGKTAAEYDARIEVPTSRSLVMTTARETLESAYLSAGRPDAYHEDMSYYVTDEQFGYVAYLTGYMVREKPAACFYLGAFFAESLILAETGNSIGAIQVAGTAEPAQLPFFVAACDYTLIGEEFFAASAYLSGEPEQLGTLKGQDVGKIIGGLLLVVGCVLATYASMSDSPIAQKMQNYLMFRVLGTDPVEEEMLEPETTDEGEAGVESDVETTLMERADEPLVSFWGIDRARIMLEGWSSGEARAQWQEVAS